jgi:hypothetical protein
VGRLAGWDDGIWSRRYQSIPVSGEEGAQIARLKYVLSHGVKEELVKRPPHRLTLAQCSSSGDVYPGGRFIEVSG